MSFSGWVMSVTAAIAVGALADIVMAEGNTRKFVKGVSALIVFAALIAPLPALFGSEFSFDIFSDRADENYLEESMSTVLDVKSLSFEEKMERAGLGEVVVSLHTGSGKDAGEVILAVITVFPETFEKEMSPSEAEEFIRSSAEAYFSLSGNMVIVVGV